METKLFLPPLQSVRKNKKINTRLTESPVVLHLYHHLITDQKACGFIEKVLPSSPSTGVYYLPHHPVNKYSVTTPICIVCDCSCHKDKKSASLNGCLLVGPPFLNDLCVIIVCFCTHVLHFPDLEKAFLHVKLYEPDRNST